jgi:hypothetical protein
MRMHMLSKRMLLQVRIGAKVTRVGVEYVVAQVLMLRRSLKRRAQGHAPRPSLTYMLRKGKEKEKEKANLVSYVGIMSKRAPASMVTTVDLRMNYPKRNQRNKDKEVAARIRRLKIPLKGAQCALQKEPIQPMMPGTGTRMKPKNSYVFAQKMLSFATKMQS